MNLNGEQGQKYFCFLFIKTHQQAYICFSFTFIVILLMGKTIHQFYKSHKNKLLTNTFTIFYVLVLLWGIVQQAKFIDSQIMFWNLQAQQSSTEISQRYQKYSKILFTIVIISIYLIQTLIMFIPYNWSQNIILVFRQLSQQNYKNQIKFDIFCIWFFKFFLALRTIIVLILIPFLIANKSDESQQITVKIILILLPLSPIIIVTFLILGLVATKNNKKLKQIVQQQQINKMVKYYIILIICASIRLINQLLFTYFNFYQLAQQDSCYINTDQSMIWRIINLIMEGPLTHYLPIFIVLNIFDSSNQEVDDLSTLLGNQSTVIK